MVVHPHAETHIEDDPQIEQLMRDTDPMREGICFDTAHGAYLGGDPLAFMPEDHALILYLHLKSVDPEEQKQVNANEWPFAKPVSMNVFCGPDTGMVDFPASLDVLKARNGSGCGTVEQNVYQSPTRAVDRQEYRPCP